MSAQWSIVVFEGRETEQFDHEIAFVEGPFGSYEEAIAWAENERVCADGKWQIAPLDAHAKKEITA